jgi:hypothetical protein
VFTVRYEPNLYIYLMLLLVFKELTVVSKIKNIRKIFNFVNFV